MTGVRLAGRRAGWPGRSSARAAEPAGDRTVDVLVGLAALDVGDAIANLETAWLGRAAGRLHAHCSRIGGPGGWPIAGSRRAR